MISNKTLQNVDAEYSVDCFKAVHQYLPLEIQHNVTVSDVVVLPPSCRMGGGAGEQSQYTAPHLPGALPSWQCYPGR